jgi:integrase
MGNGRRTRIEKNIYRFDSGRYDAIVTVTGRPARHKGFAPDVSLERIRHWVETTREELIDDIKAFGVVPAASRHSRRGTLDVDAADYLEQIKGRAGSAADRSHLRAWLAVVVPGESKPLGELDRSQITAGHVNKTIALWSTAASPHAIRRVRVAGYARATQSIKDHVRAAPATSGFVVAARTIRHRCRVLADLYHTLDGAQAPTPVDEAKVPAIPKTPPVVLPAKTMQTVLTKLAQLDVPTFARFAVVTTTGQRPCQVARAKPEDVNLKERTWLVRDAKGEQAHPITLNDTQAAAWKTFIAAKAWGAFDTGKYGKLIHAAGWPKGIKPYAARHSIAREAIRRGISLGDVQALLGHADPSTTRIYAPFVIDRQRQVSDAMTSYLADVFKMRLVKKGRGGK